MNENRSITVTAAGNEVIKETVRLLGSKRERDAQGVFVAEGRKLVFEAYDNGCVLKRLFISSHCENDYTRLESAAEYVYRIPPQLMCKITESKTPQDITAVFAYGKNRSDLSGINKGRYVCLEHIQDPVNMGALIRSAACFGLDGVIITADCADIYSMKVLRGSMGAVFRIPVYTADSMPEAISMLRQRGFTAYATALREDALSIIETEISDNCLLIIGNEGNGLTDETIAASDRIIIIPMQKGSESLNAAVAGGIIMWEAAKHGC